MRQRRSDHGGGQPDRWSRAAGEFAESASTYGHGHPSGGNVQRIRQTIWNPVPRGAASSRRRRTSRRGQRHRAVRFRDHPQAPSRRWTRTPRLCGYTRRATDPRRRTCTVARTASAERQWHASPSRRTSTRTPGTYTIDETTCSPARTRIRPCRTHSRSLPSEEVELSYTDPVREGALAILKNSTKGGAVTTAGAVFSYDSSSVTDNGAGDEDPTIGEICVSGLDPVPTRSTRPHRLRATGAPASEEDQLVTVRRDQLRRQPACSRCHGDVHQPAARRHHRRLQGRRLRRDLADVNRLRGPRHDGAPTPRPSAAGTSRRRTWTSRSIRHRGRSPARS